MADKVAGGAWHEGPPSAPDEPAPPDDVQRITQRRDNARWTAAVGFLMLFAGRFSVDFAIGGMLMAGYGAAASVFWSRRLRKVKGDPWAYDPELDGPDSADWKAR